jgi:hypothetical protein
MSLGILRFSNADQHVEHVFHFQTAQQNDGLYRAWALGIPWVSFCDVDDYLQLMEGITLTWAYSIKVLCIIQI